MHHLAIQYIVVSTHSRTEAAAYIYGEFLLAKVVSTHSRTEAAAKLWEMRDHVILVSTHSRTEAAAKTQPFLK